MELPMSRRANQTEIDNTVIASQPSMTAAINLCISISGLEDKEIYQALDIDPGHWTRIRKGDAHFPPNKLDALCSLCGNDAPLRWWAHIRGYELKPLRSDLEKRLDDALKENRELQKEIATLQKYGYLKGGGHA
jgi:hypothetical protein